MVFSLKHTFVLVPLKKISPIYFGNICWVVFVGNDSNKVIFMGTNDAAMRHHSIFLFILVTGYRFGMTIGSQRENSRFSSNHLFKQFVVTNCSKERPGSIVNETLKNGILMIKDTSKESDLHADFKYISFIKFSLCHQKLRAWENLPYFRK